MRLQQWAANGWLRPHQTTKQQVADLFAIVERDLDDVGGDEARWNANLHKKAILLQI